MENSILRLAETLPSGLTEDEWAYCIYWTWNLNANFGSALDYVPTNDLERICRGLEDRINRGADLTTIDWVWDQFTKAYPPASAYEKYRPTSAQNATALRTTAMTDESLSYFRSEYQRRRARQGIVR